MAQSLPNRDREATRHRFASQNAMDFDPRHSTPIDPARISQNGCGVSTSLLLVFLDHTASVKDLRNQLARFAVQAAASAPAGTVVEAATFGSEVRLAPFYTGPIRRPATFHAAVSSVLSQPAPGRGTFGAPILRRVRERIEITQKSAVVLVLSDCGFDDLADLKKEALLLSKEPRLLALHALPAVSRSNAYTKLESALRPLGNRLRVAAMADAHEALRELQSTLRTGGR